MDNEELIKTGEENTLSGIDPFKVNFIKAYSVLLGEECARYYDLTVNSLSGALPHSLFSVAVDKQELAFDVFEACLSDYCGNVLQDKANSLMNNEPKKKEFEETWFYASPRFLSNGGERVINLIQTVIKKYNVNECLGSMCLCFSKDILWLDDGVLKGIEKISEIGVKVAIKEVGDSACPLTMLSKARFDYVSLYSDFVKESKAKTNVTSAVALVDYVKALGSKVYAVADETEKDFLRKVGVTAYWSVDNF